MSKKTRYKARYKAVTRNVVIDYIPEAFETFIEKGFLSTGINPE